MEFKQIDVFYDNISYSFSGKDISGSYYENKVLYERKLLLCVDFFYIKCCLWIRLICFSVLKERISLFKV